MREFRKATEKIASKIGPEGAEGESLYYIEFRAIAQQVKPHCHQLEKRATSERAQV